MAEESLFDPRERRREVGLYLAITFGITWSLAIAVIGFPVWFESHFGALTGTSPVFYVAVWAPNVAALILTISRGGWSALKALFSALFRWRVSPLWWIVALGFYPALMLTVQLVGAASGKPMAPPQAWWAAALQSVNLAALLLGPLGEELGWRGYLLPRVIDRFSPALAALIVGVIWMVWHIPAFLVSGLPQSGMAFPVFFFGGVALSVFVTWIFVNTRGSILLAGIIPHAIANGCGGTVGDMSLTQGAVLVIAAVLLIAFTGRTLRGRGEGGS